LVMFRPSFLSSPLQILRLADHMKIGKNVIPSLITRDQVITVHIRG